MRYLTIWIGAVALAILGAVALLIYLGGQGPTLETYHYLRGWVAILTVVFAVITVTRMISRVAIRRNLPDEFLPEMIGYVLFWVLVPPVWFFVEYYAFDSHWITLSTPDTDSQLASIKAYSDFASKVWAAVIAMLIFFVSLKRDPKDQAPHTADGMRART
jgi:hypothetical protein